MVTDNVEYELIYALIYISLYLYVSVFLSINIRCKLVLCQLCNLLLQKCGCSVYIIFGEERVQASLHQPSAVSIFKGLFMKF